MELDAIKLAKKLSPFTKITLIAKEAHYIANAKEEYIGFNGIQLETISFKTNLSLSIILGVRKIARQYNIKNVIFFGASELKSLYFSFLGLDINLIIRHGTTKSRPKKDWFHRLIYSNVAYHVSICRHLMDNVRYIIPFGKNTREKLIYSSIDMPKTERVKHETLTLLHVGRIAQGKGQYDALLACDVLYKNNIDFIFYIVGGFDPLYEEKFMELYNSLSYKNQIKLVGFTKDVRYYLERSDIFLFPSHGEGLSNAFLEALASELFCVCYDNTSFPELKSLGLEFLMSENENIDVLKETLLKAVVELEHSEFFYNYKKVQELFGRQKEILAYHEILQ